MKKLAIAASSVALAAMPVVGVFALDTDDLDVVDIIKVTVDSSCTFRASGDGTLDGTYTAHGSNGQTVTPSISGGTNVHTFNVFCNNNKGYTVTATAQALSNIDSATPPIADTFAYKNDLSTLDATKSGWHAQFAASTEGVDAVQLPDAGTGTIITRANSSTATAGDAWTATYTAKIGSETKAGNYQGTITYNLVATPVNAGN